MAPRRLSGPPAGSPRLPLVPAGAVPRRAGRCCAATSSGMIEMTSSRPDWQPALKASASRATRAASALARAAASCQWMTSRCISARARASWRRIAARARNLVARQLIMGPTAAPRWPEQGGRSSGHLLRGRGGPLPDAGRDSAGETGRMALASSAVKSNPDHYQDSLVCWFRMGSLVSAGLAGSDRWPSSMSGTEWWAVPATSLHRDHDLRSARGGARARWRRAGPGAVARAGPMRRADGPAGAKGGGTLRPCPLAIMWPPALLAATSIERQRFAVGNG